VQQLDPDRAAGSTTSVRPGVTGIGLTSAEPQQPVAAAGPESSEQTPVCGSTSATRRAASQSPAIALTTERACSYPVSIKKVGARP
jgi:hypothetical protein